MVLKQTKSKRTPSGGQYKDYRKLRQYEIGSMPTLTKVGEHKVRKDRVTGGHSKVRVLNAGIANLLDPKTKKFVKAKIQTVTESPANRHFVRRNIITKGSIIQTDKGKAKVTSRPAQDGTINAVLIA